MDRGVHNRCCCIGFSHSLRVMSCVGVCYGMDWGEDML